MISILKDSESELVVTVRSPLYALLGWASILCLAYLVYILIIAIPSTDSRMIGLILASVTSALAFFVLYEKADFSFDLVSRTLNWSRQRGLFKQADNVSFAAIQRVTLQSSTNGDKDYPGHRVALLTRDGELPLQLAYEHDGMNEVIAEKIIFFLDLPNTLLQDSISDLVKRGRDVDAIRLLMKKVGMAKADARNAITAIKDGKPIVIPSLNPK